MLQPLKIEPYFTPGSLNPAAGRIALLVTLFVVTSVLAQAAIPVRGFKRDLSQVGDRFIPLDLKGGQENGSPLLSHRHGGWPGVRRSLPVSW